jgi:hypothetical protein
MPLCEDCRRGGDEHDDGAAGPGQLLRARQEPQRGGQSAHPSQHATHRAAALFLASGFKPPCELLQSTYVRVSGCLLMLGKCQAHRFGSMPAQPLPCFSSCGRPPRPPAAPVMRMRELVEDASVGLGSPTTQRRPLPCLTMPPAVRCHVAAAVPRGRPPRMAAAARGWGVCDS